MRRLIPALTLTPGLVLAATLSVTPSASAETARADINGDGVADNVTVGFVGTGAEKRCRVKVVTSTGVTKALRLGRTETCSLHGTALVDGRRGKEIVVTTSPGAWMAAEYRVVGLMRGELINERIFSEGSAWETDYSMTTAIGLQRRVVDGRVLMIKRSLTKQSPNRWTGHALRLTPYRDGWRVVSRTRIVRTGADAERISGWHVRGLPR